MTRKGLAYIGGLLTCLCDVSLLQYYDELAPNEEVATSTEDISKLISSEVKDLKDKKKQIFTLHKTAIGGLLYVIMSKDAQGNLSFTHRLTWMAQLECIG